MEILVIGAIRVAGSFPVLRWAFVGGLIAVFVDLSDLFLMNLLDLGGLGNYQQFDKYSDQVYLFAFLIVANRWSGPPRFIAIGLFAYRLLGFIVFEAASGDRSLLLFFPNLFEFWFLFVASLPHWRPDFVYTRAAVLRWGAFLLAIKEFQEFALHEARWLDDFTAIEAVQAVWETLSSPF